MHLIQNAEYSYYARDFKFTFGPLMRNINIEEQCTMLNLSSSIVKYGKFSLEQRKS